jgi:hypothetical protein
VELSKSQASWSQVRARSSNLPGIGSCRASCKFQAGLGVVSARCWVAGHGSRPLLVGGSAWTALSVTGAYVHHVPVIGNYSAHAGGDC